SIDSENKFFERVAKEFNGQIRNATPDFIRHSNTTGNRPPEYKAIFKATPNGSGKWSVNFRKDSDPDTHPNQGFFEHLEKMIVWSHDVSAGFCIQKLGFSWINGLLQKAGLFYPASQTGIWLAGDYLFDKPTIDRAHKDHRDHPHDQNKGPNDNTEAHELGI